jgi:PPOX class probable F420-dependent enzyme
MPLPDNARRLLQGKNFAFLGTIGPDAAPQVTPVWIDVEGETPVFNTAVGRAKERHIRANPNVTIAILDPENPYAYVEIRGRARFESEGADAHIDHLAKKYLDADSYPSRREGEERVKVYVEPERVLGDA